MQNWEEQMTLVNNSVLLEAKRLYDLGLAVHWLQPNSKVPVKSGWTAGDRDNWDTLRNEYRAGYGLGVRLGQASYLNNGYLAVIDVDLKSGLKEHRLEAQSVIDRHYPGVRKNAPLVKTGRGFHIYLLTDEPAESRKIETSKELTKVYMPNERISRVQLEAVRLGVLSESELQQGYRSRPAWQVELMAEGKQVVAPPTIHPDTGVSYEWKRGLVK